MKSKHRYWKLPGGRETAALCTLWPVAHRGTVLRWRTARGAAGVAEIVTVCAITSGGRGRKRDEAGAVACAGRRGGNARQAEQEFWQRSGASAGTDAARMDAGERAAWPSGDGCGAT